MKSMKAFTLIELLIVIAIFGIVFAIIAPHIFGTAQSSTNPTQSNYVSPVDSVGPKCIDGLKFTGVGGQQIVDEHGFGVKCN